MATIDLVNIALKSTAKMSLNQRFQLLRQNQMKRQNSSLINTNKLAQNNTRQLRQGSQKNRRLALQMANRPSVLAALRTQNQNNPNNRPVKQRLGIKRFNNNQNRGLNTNRVQNNRTLNVNRVQTNRAFNVNRVQTKPRINRNFNQNTNGLNRNRNQSRKNNAQNIGVVVGVRRKALQRNRLRRTQTFKTTANVNAINGKRRFGAQIRNQNQNKAGPKKRFQINRNFNARNIGAKPQNQQKRRNVKPNKEQLDNDLDAYMAGTKSHLDAELDAYMSQE